MMHLTVTLDQLCQAFYNWEQDSRSGECLPQEDIRNLSTEEVAKRATTTLVEYLAAL